MADDLVPLVAHVSPLPTIPPGTSYSASISAQGGLRVSNVDPAYASLAINGSTYALSAGVVANAKVPITDFGTTTAAWALYNGSATGAGGYAVIPLFISLHLASGTAAVGATLLAGMSTAAQSSAVTSNTGIVGPKSLSGSSARTSLATLGGAVTLAGAPAWVPIAAVQNPAATTPGSGVVVDVQGMFVIPPSFALGITVLSGTGTTAKWAVSVIYAEIPAYLV
jgi:hypothetical protein